MYTWQCPTPSAPRNSRPGAELEYDGRPLLKASRASVLLALSACTYLSVYAGLRSDILFAPLGRNLSPLCLSFCPSLFFHPLVFPLFFSFSAYLIFSLSVCRLPLAGNPDRIRESVQCISLDCQVKRLREAHDQQLGQAFQAGVQDLRQKKRAAYQQLLAVRLILSHRNPKGKCAGQAGAGSAGGTGPSSSSFVGCLNPPICNTTHNAAPSTSPGDASKGGKELQKVEEILSLLDSPAYASTRTTEEERDALKGYLSSLIGVDSFTLRDLRQTLEFQLTDINAKLDSIFDHRRLDKASLLPACRYQALLTCDIIFTTLSSSATDILCPYALSETVGLGVSSSGLVGGGSSKAGAGAIMMGGGGGGKEKRGLASASSVGVSSLSSHNRNYLRATAQSGCGGYLSPPPFSYAYLIVDEAGQASEISCLIPLRLAPDRCILVGDPQQLPSTVFSALAESRGLGRSLLERLMLCAGELMASPRRREENSEELQRTAGAHAGSSSSSSGTGNTGIVKDKEASVEDEGGQKPDRQGPATVGPNSEEDKAGGSGTQAVATSVEPGELKSQIRGGVSLAVPKTSGGTDLPLRVNVLTTQYRMRDEIVRFPVSSPRRRTRPCVARQAASL